MTDAERGATPPSEVSDAADAVPNCDDVPDRLRPLLALFDVSRAELDARLAGVDDAEWRWEPAPNAWTVRPDGAGGWRRDSSQDRDPDGTVRTIAWLAGHLAEMGRSRADWTIGSRTHDPTIDVAWAGTADAGLAALRDGLDAWREVLTTATDQDLDTVGRSAWSWGLDPQLPLLDIVWWMDRELAHHAAEIAYVRDLYGQLGQASPPNATDQGGIR